mgnify:CR=1 FL=1
MGMPPVPVAVPICVMTFRRCGPSVRSVRVAEMFATDASGRSHRATIARDARTSRATEVLRAWSRKDPRGLVRDIPIPPEKRGLPPAKLNATAEASAETSAPRLHGVASAETTATESSSTTAVSGRPRGTECKQVMPIMLSIVLFSCSLARPVCRKYCASARFCSLSLE